VISSGSPWPRKRAAPAIEGIRVGSRPITRAAVTSVATGSVPKINTPACTGVPWIGPLPCMPTMPSTICTAGRTAAATSTIAWSSPIQCRRFFGHP
jgi:hypothetical protein